MNDFRDVMADGYGGVIWSGDDCRLVVSPRGSVYSIQVRTDGGSWQLERNFPSASALGAWLACVAVDPSPALLEAGAGLPDDPASSGFSPYRRSVF